MIRQLCEDDAEAYRALRRRALIDAPLAFAASVDDDRFAALDVVCRQLGLGPDSVILGAFAPDLVGAVGLYRDPHVKASHKVHVWGMYVDPAHRQHGLAAQLLDAALQHARGLHGVTWVHLSVSSAAAAAKRLYVRAGFQVWGVEPQALRHDDQTVFQHHMALALRGEGQAPPADATAAAPGTVSVLAISGSLRAGSSNTALLHALRQLAPPRVRVHVFDRLGELPAFNPDHDGPVAPPSVAALRARLAAADALVISSPEYAHGVPGVLKNALDWLVSGVEILGKPVAVLNASPQGSAAYASLCEVLRTMAAVVVPEASLTVPLAGRDLDVAAVVADPRLSALIGRSLAALTAAVDLSARAAGTDATPLSGAVRAYVPSDHAEWLRMRTALWPAQSVSDMAAWLARPDAAVIVAERSPAELCGFAEIGSRSIADGCRTSPVAYLEGWYVDADARRRGVGGALIRAVMAWARERGYRELASDTRPGNHPAQRAHEQVGFVEEGHAVQYRMEL